MKIERDGTYKWQVNGEQNVLPTKRNPSTSVRGKKENYPHGVNTTEDMHIGNPQNPGSQDDISYKLYSKVEENAIKCLSFSPLPLKIDS